MYNFSKVGSRQRLGVYMACAAVVMATAGAAHATTPPIKFAPVTYYPTGQSLDTTSLDENGTATGDFNGDGLPDVVAVDQWEGSTVVVQNNLGNGKFQTPGTVITINGGSSVEDVVVGKFTKSGRDDIIVTTASSFYVLTNNGNGTFAQSSPYTLQQSPFQTSLVAVDLNGDGNRDLAIKTPSGVQAELGDGNGNFTAGPLSPVGNFDAAITSVEVANINGDGIPDLFASDAVSQNIYALTGNGKGGFTSKAIGTAAVVPGSVVAVKDTANGLDSAVGLSEFNLGVGSATMFANKGDGTFAAGKTYSGGFGVAAGTHGDLNGDGWGDVVSDDTVTGNQVILAGDGSGNLVQAGSFASGTNSQTPVVADFNGDGKPDIAVTTTCPDYISSVTNASCLAVLINQS